MACGWASLVTLAAAAAVVGCASTETAPPGAGLLDAKEQRALAASADAPEGERFRVVRRPPSIGPVRWDPDRSNVGVSCPANLLQKIRDEAGRLNQKTREGTKLGLTVQVDRCRPETLFAPPMVSYAFVLTNAESRKSLVVGAGEIWVESELLESSADDRASAVGREVRRRVERGLDGLKVAGVSKREE
jgi:hypothetical protein